MKLLAGFPIRGCGRLRYARVVHLAASMKKAGATGLLSVTPLQQAHAGRSVPALPGDCRKHGPSDHRLQRRAGPVNVEPATLARLPLHFRISSVSRSLPGNIGQMVEICRFLPADFIVLGRRCADAAVDGGGRQGA